MARRPGRPAGEMHEARVERELAGILNLDHAALKERWRTIQDGDPPQRLSRQLLLRALAHAIQEKAYGGLRPAVRQRLQRLAAELQSTGSISSVGRHPRFKSGTRLIREWQGCTHEVVILEHGFQWNGSTYRSLSAIARAITGTRWNGHVFFALRSRQTPDAARSATDHHGEARKRKDALTRQSNGANG